MEKDKKVIAIIAVISCFIILLLGISVAWLSFETDGGNVELESAELEIEYQKGNDVFGEVTTSIDRFGGVNTTVTISKTKKSVDAKMNLYLNIVELPTALQTESLKWEVYREGEGDALAIGTFQNYYPGAKITLISNEVVNDTPTDYTVYIWLDKKTAINSNVHEQRFLAKVTASATQSIAEAE